MCGTYIYYTLFYLGDNIKLSNFFLVDCCDRSQRIIHDTMILYSSIVTDRLFTNSIKENILTV